MVIAGASIEIRLTHVRRDADDFAPDAFDGPAALQHVMGARSRSMHAPAERIDCQGNSAARRLWLTIATGAGAVASS